MSHNSSSDHGYQQDPEPQPTDSQKPQPEPIKFQKEIHPQQFQSQQVYPQLSQPQQFQPQQFQPQQFQQQQFQFQGIQPQQVPSIQQTPQLSGQIGYVQFQGQPQLPYIIPQPQYFAPRSVGLSLSQNPNLFGGEYSANFNENSPNEAFLGTAKERLMMREYEVLTGKWFDEAWKLFKDQWASLVLFTILFLGVQFIPYIGYILTISLSPGFFIAGTHVMRQGNLSSWKGSHLFHGTYLFFPILWLGLLYFLAVFLGLFLCIIPGFYLMVSLSFAQYVYIEYRQEGVGILDSLVISNHVIGKHFCAITGFLIIVFLLMFAGFLFFIVGALISIPVGMLMFGFAFRDIFGLSSQRNQDSFVCC